MNDFNIQAASLMSGVSVHQIRAWEKRYNAVIPKRLGNNFRSYSQENITRLKLLGQLTRQGISISKIAGLPTEELKKQFDSLEIGEISLQQPEPAIDTKEKLDLLLNFLVVKRFDLVKHEVLKLTSLGSVTGVIIPMMKFLMNDFSSFQEQESKNLFKILVEETNRISIRAQSKCELQHMRG